jgi:hypothetical protein
LSRLLLLQKKIGSQKVDCAMMNAYGHFRAYKTIISRAKHKTSLQYLLPSDARIIPSGDFFELFVSLPHAVINSPCISANKMFVDCRDDSDSQQPVQMNDS